MRSQAGKMMKSMEITDFGDGCHDRFIHVDGGRIQLAPTLLLTNEMGVCGDLEESLTAREWSKVEFDVPSAQVKGAELLFYVNADTRTQTTPMTLFVNGQRLSHRQRPERMLTGGWDRTRIPPRHLREGRNEFVFASSGVLHIDPGQGGCSSRSFDGGRSWHVNALGPEAQTRGEYLVRLRLRGYAPCGQLTSPVIDLADPDAHGGIAPRLSFGRLRFTSRGSSPTGTKVSFELRSGSTPAFDARAWTPWQKGTTVARPGRFVQWRATLATTRADRTPMIESVQVSATVKGQGRSNTNGVSLVELDQPQIERSSYAFAYLAPHPRAKRLVKTYRLEEVIAPGRTELEQLALLRDWVHSQWLGWQADKYPYCPPWDPLEILEVTKGNWGFGMCTHYGAVFAGCAAALGFVARVIVVDHHCLAEVWSEQLQKWILQDAGPGREHDATYEYRGVPLNALEVHRLAAADKVHHVTINKLPQKTKGRMTKAWGGRLFVRFGIPLRNDHLVAAKPAELHHGYRGYHWDGYLWWADAAEPRYAEYSLQTSRPQDFYWSVNQTRMYPEADTQAGTLEVQLETVTPNFSHFLVQRDSGLWEETQAPLSWQLHAGDNHLAVRSVNAFGRAGRAARCRVVLGAAK